MEINIFTAAMRSEFINSYNQQDPAKPAPWEKYTTVIPSTARIENYAWMSPTPGMAQYKGHRRLGKIDSTKYKIENLEYDASFEVLNRDIEDDQVGGYKYKAQELAARANNFPGRLALKTLSQAETLTGFDGTAIAANSHTLGVGDNLLAATGSGTAGSFNIAALFHGGVLKPLVFQDRKKAQFMDDAGEKASKFAKKTRFWVDLEGAGGFGYWWDLVWVNVTNLPTVLEAHDILRQIFDAFRTFTLPKSVASDDAEYVHEQDVFDQNSLTLVVSTGLYEIFRQALNQDIIVKAGTSAGAETNIFKGAASLVASGFMN